MSNSTLFQVETEPDIISKAVNVVFDELKPL